LATQLERADRGAVAIDTTLHLTTRTTHVRRLELPAPMRDARVLRTLILLDLESHPPPAGIDAVELRVDVTPGRIVQRSLLARAAAGAGGVGGGRARGRGGRGVRGCARRLPGGARGAVPGAGGRGRGRRAGGRGLAGLRGREARAGGLSPPLLQSSQFASADV